MDKKTRERKKEMTHKAKVFLLRAAWIAVLLYLYLVVGLDDILLELRH